MDWVPNAGGVSLSVPDHSRAPSARTPRVVCKLLPSHVCARQGAPAPLLARCYRARPARASELHRGVADSTEDDETPPGYRCRWASVHLPPAVRLRAPWSQSAGRRHVTRRGVSTDPSCLANAPLPPSVCDCATVGRRLAQPREQAEMLPRTPGCSSLFYCVAEPTALPPETQTVEQ